MATAADLLKSTPIQPDPEGHIIVGGDRFITVPDNLKRLGVQYDHNMETVVFDCPRYWDNRDMSKMVVYINYMLSDGYADRYPADNVTADDEIMHFEWTISRNVTQVAGAVSFLVCVMKTDSEGNEERHWNSELNQECYISKGMETEESPVDMYPDLVTQLLLRMSSVEQINVQAEEMQALYDATVDAANTAEDVKNEALDASDYIKNSYAPAVKGNVSGEIIRVDDVSPIKHDVACWTHGKNIFNGQLLSGYIVDTSCRLTEVASAVYRTILIDLKKGTYTLSSSVDLLILRIVMNGRYYNAGPTGRTYTFTLEQDGRFAISFRTNPSADWDDSIELQLEEGSAATAYTPWIDPTSITVYDNGKNLLDYSSMKESQTVNGVTITRTDDVITFSGTTTAASVLFNYAFCLYGKIGTNYTLSYRYVGGSVTGSASLCVGDSNSPSDPRQSWLNVTMKTNANGSYTVPAIKDYIKDMWFYCDSGVQFTSFKIQVQLEVGDEATEYEPYTGTEYNPTSDGLCTVTSLSPTMTLMLDTPGVTIEAEYNRDTTKMFESYVLTDEAKNEIAGLASVEAGGYYIPSLSQVDADTVKMSYVASKNGMPIVNSQSITLPSGGDVLPLSIEWITGKYIASTGVLQGNTSYSATDYIPMPPLGFSLSYRVAPYAGYIARYDENKLLIDVVAGNTDNTTDIITGVVSNSDGCRYVRFTNLHTKYETPFIGVCALDTAIPIDNSIPGTVLTNGTVSADKAAFIKHAPWTNLLKEDLWIQGYYVRGDDTGKGAYKASSDLWATQKIPLEAGKSYAHGKLYAGYYAFYDADGVFISGNNVEKLPNPFVVPEGACYGAFTANSVANKNGAWIGAQADYAYILNADIYATPLPEDYTGGNPCDFEGDDICAFTKGVCIGDSLTAGTMNYTDSDGGTGFSTIRKYSFPANLARLTGLEITNKGDSGASSAEWYEAHSGDDLTGHDFAIIQLGVNDAIRYGGWTDTSVTAFTSIIDKLKTENKNIKIFVATIMPAASYGNNDAQVAVSKGIRDYVTGLADTDVILLDLAAYGHTNDQTAYNCGHLSAYGYWRLAKDYKAYISWYMRSHPLEFREVQFIGTDYVYSTS